MLLRGTCSESSSEGRTFSCQEDTLHRVPCQVVGTVQGGRVAVPETSGVQEDDDADDEVDHRDTSDDS